jgi:catechol 2,3-dioxygenase-like lactoylglutathione lyase family enzyme
VTDDTTTGERAPPALATLALETTDLSRATLWYADRLGLVPVARTATETVFDVGGSRLVLRRPDSVPRGGLHVHYALETPAREWPAWRARFPDAETVSFGDAHSVYPFDPDGHCPEIAGFGDDGCGLTGVFEFVLEVASRADAEAAYRELGFEPVDRSERRRRVRLRGPADAARPVDLELWEPQLGLADARGGVHVDFELRVADPAAAAERAFGDHPAVHPHERADGSVELYDPDGHHLVLSPRRG